MREHWRAHYGKVKCIIYVIDSVDRHRLQENSVELRRLLDSPRLVGVPMLFLANKQDVAGALPASEIEACLHLHTIRDRPWNCFGCSALRCARSVAPPCTAHSDGGARRRLSEAMASYAG